MEQAPIRRGVVDLAARAERVRTQTVRGECFICALCADPRDELIVYEDELVVCFLPNFLTMPGRILLAPREHRTEVVDDFDEDEYLAIQRRVHRIGRALTDAFDGERLYVFSFGSREGVAQVHWHLAVLPSGVPFAEQQHHAVMLEHGYVEYSDSDKQALADRIRRALVP